MQWGAADGQLASVDKVDGLIARMGGVVWTAVAVLTQWGDVDALSINP